MDLRIVIIQILNNYKFSLTKGFSKYRKRENLDRTSDSLQEYDDLLNALTITSNSLIGRQRKSALSMDANCRRLRHATNTFITKHLANHIFEARVRRTI